jgi:hypothetical protein
VQLSPVLLNGSKFDQSEYVKALQRLLVAIAFLEGHRSYEGSVKALEQAKELLVQVRRKCVADFVSVVSVLSRGERDEHGMLQWVEPSKHDVSRAAQLLDYLLISGVDPTELLREYGKQRFDVIRMFLGEDPSGRSMGFDLSRPVSALAQCLEDIQVTVEAEKVLAGLIFSNEELANGAFRFSAHQLLASWKTDIDVSLRSPTQLDAVKLLLVHDLLLARAEALEAAVRPPLLFRERKPPPPAPSDGERHSSTLKCFNFRLTSSCSQSCSRGTAASSSPGLSVAPPSREEPRRAEPPRCQ